jgi:hypothetical protein
MFHQYPRILLILGVLLSGLAIVPFVGFPEETFEWQRYADVYEEPELMVNYPDGKPGSYFHFTGKGFTQFTGASLSQNGLVTITANGNVLGNASTDNSGNVEFNLSTTVADIGSYYIKVEDSNMMLSVRIILSESAPLRPLEGSGDIFNVPIGISLTELFMPVIKR